MGWPSIAVCMLAVVVTVSAQCSSPTFTAFPNEHIRGGNLDSSVGDLAACKDSCVADNSCFAVDVIEVNPFRCYKLSDPTLSRETQNGVTHYRMKQICEISSTRCTYDGYSSYKFSNYLNQTAESTYDTCAGSCANKGNSCIGFSYNSQVKICQLAGSGHFANTNLQKDNTWKTLKKVSCKTVCVPFYAKKVDKSSPGGSIQANINSESDCKSACAENNNCVGFDLEKNGVCWIHKNPGNLDADRNSPGIIQYVLIARCPEAAICQPSYWSKVNTHSPNGVFDSTLTSEDSCKWACAKDFYCRGFDLKQNQANQLYQCWLHTNKTNFDQKLTINGITQYTLSDRCPQGTTVTDKTTTAGCVITYTSSSSISSPNGVRISSATSQAMCETACTSDSACLAFDLDLLGTVPSCWLHKSASNLNQKRNTPGISQFVKINTCSSSSTTSILTTTESGCQIRWNNLTSTGSAGAMLQSGLTFLDDCLKGCIFDTSCVAVDFNFKAIPKQCWFHTEMNKVQANRRDVQTNQYILDRCYKSPCPKFTPYINKHAIGGLQQNDANSKDQCEQKCLASSDCQGYDFDTQIAGCFIFNMVTREENLLTQISTNHYELVCRSGETVPPSALPTTTKAAGSSTQWLATTIRNY